MSTVVLKALGIRSLSDKRVLLFGGGKIASEALRVLSSQLGLSEVDVITKSADLKNIKSATKDSSIAISEGSLSNLSDYDIVICHTSAIAPIISDEHISQLRPGSVIASFISSTEHGELPDSIYNAYDANIIVDWDKTISSAKDMQRAQDAKLFSDSGVVKLKDLLAGTSIDTTKRYTVYRSTGTPIQNLATLHYLLKFESV